jgi:hypothetical protein
MEQPTIASQSLWSARFPNGEVRSGTLAQLNDAFRAGQLGGDTLVCAAGRQEWAKLADILDPSIVQVRLPDGQVRSGTRAQLEEALNAGHLDEGTPVRAAGTSEWVTLGTIASRPPPPPSPSVAPVARASAPSPAAPPAETATTPVEPLPPVAAEAAPQAADVPEETPAAVAAVAAEPEAPARDHADDTAPQPVVIEPRWQVRLTDEQLEAAFRAGLLGDDAFVLAVGTTEWVRFGDIRQTSSAAG